MVEQKDLRPQERSQQHTHRDFGIRGHEGTRGLWGDNRPKGGSLGCGCQQGRPTWPALPPVWEAVYLTKLPGPWGLTPNLREAVRWEGGIGK